MSTTSQRVLSRKKRHARVRRNVAGRAERPRLSIFRSLGHISAQVIDDAAGQTLVSASSTEAELRKGEAKRGVGAAAAVGKLIAERAGAKGISTVVFDRGGNLYHGRVKALAEAARAAGLDF